MWNTKARIGALESLDEQHVDVEAARSVALHAHASCTAFQCLHDTKDVMRVGCELASNDTIEIGRLSLWTANRSSFIDRRDHKIEAQFTEPINGIADRGPSIPEICTKSKMDTHKPSQAKKMS
jgi:hypothetical protein